MKLFDEIPLCPYICKFAPRNSELRSLFLSLNKIGLPEEIDFLEFGCGYSSWFLYHCLTPRKYVAVETFKLSIEKVNEHLDSIHVVNKYEDIPKGKYNLIFLDSESGSDSESKRAGRYREGALIYADNNNLISDDCILVVHDFCKMMRHGPHDPLAKTPQGKLHKVLELDGKWELVDAIRRFRGFGIYKVKG